MRNVLARGDNDDQETEECIARELYETFIQNSTPETALKPSSAPDNSVSFLTSSRSYIGSMAQTVETLIRENIYGIFSEHDAHKRRIKIAALWAEDGVFIAPEARYEGHSGIERAAAGFIETFPDFTFTDRGEVQSYNGVGKIAWAFGPAGGEAVITGIDVLVMKGDKIGAVYVFQDS